MMNKRLLMLSGLAILAVVLNHASNSGFIAMFWWTDRYLPVSVPNYDQMGSLAYYGLIAAQKLTLFSVPSFLFITGVFLAYTARGSQSHLTRKVVFQRVLNLLPPYLIWSGVYFLAEYLLGVGYSPAETILRVVTIEDSQFFFVPLIIVYYLLSPFLAPLAKNRPWVLLAIGAGALLVGITAGYLRVNAWLNQPDGSFFTSAASYLVERKVLEYFFYYVLGLAAGFHQTQLKAFIVRYRWALLGLTIIFGLLAVAEAEWVFRTTAQITWRSRTLTLPTAIYAVAFILTFLGFEKLSLPRFVYQLGVNTLAIYMIHQIVLLIVPKVVYHVLPAILGMQWVYQTVLVATGVFIPVLLMEVTRRLPVRKYSRLIFG